MRIRGSKLWASICRGLGRSWQRFLGRELKSARSFSGEKVSISSTLTWCKFFYESELHVNVVSRSIVEVYLKTRTIGSGRNSSTFSLNIRDIFIPFHGIMSINLSERRKPDQFGKRGGLR